MNIRKHKKRKITLVKNKDQQQTAIEKLFQISHFDNTDHFDQSQILFTDTVSYTTPNYIKYKKKTEQSQNSPAKLSIELLKKHDTLPFTTKKKKKTILNQLQSNYVFVGRKLNKKQQKQKKKSISLDQKLNSTSKQYKQIKSSKLKDIIQTCDPIFINRANKYSPIKLKTLSLQKSQSYYQNRKCTMPGIFSTLKAKSLNGIVQEMSLFSRTMKNW